MRLPRNARTAEASSIDRTHWADVAKPEENWWVPLWKFLIHVMVGVLFFLLIAMPAIGLSLLVSWLSKLNVSPFVIRDLRFRSMRYSWSI